MTNVHELSRDANAPAPVVTCRKSRRDNLLFDIVATVHH